PAGTGYSAGRVSSRRAVGRAGPRRAAITEGRPPNTREPANVRRPPVAVRARRPPATLTVLGYVPDTRLRRTAGPVRARGELASNVVRGGDVRGRVRLQRSEGRTARALASRHRQRPVGARV